jgi:N-acetylmuramoyl-L-alanine amidase
MKLIWLDAGHGGDDSGATGHGLEEDDLNLAICKLTATALQRCGFKVGQTRTADRFIELAERSRKANVAGADAFVSIHVNDTGSAKHGFEAITPTGHDVSASKRLANRIMGNLERLTPYKDVGVYADRRGLSVLRRTDMPATLVEILSVSEKSEAARLKDDKFLRAAAEAIAQGVCAFFGVKYTTLGTEHTDAAIMRRDSQLWNPTHGTKREPSPKKGGHVTVLAISAEKKWATVTWGGHTGDVAYKDIRWA